MQVDAVELTDSGLRFDRSFALIYTPKDDFPTGTTPPLARHLTIKKVFSLALFRPQIDVSWTRLTISYVGTNPPSTLAIPLTPSPLSASNAKKFLVSIFGTTAISIDMGDEAAAFFTQHLGSDIRLVFIGGDGRREIPGAKYAHNWLDAVSRSLEENLHPQRIKFADAAPLLVTSTASENEARGRLPEQDRDEDLILRFRPNIHIDVRGSLPPYDEDKWRILSIRNGMDAATQAIIRCVYPCVRCLSINADLSTGNMVSRDRQLYGLLARDRRINEAFPRKSSLQLQCSSTDYIDKPVFGQYAFAGPSGAILRVADEVSIIERDQSSSQAQIQAP